MEIFVPRPKNDEVLVEVDATVAKLLIPGTGIYNEVRIRALFIEEDANVVLGIQIHVREEEDQLLWLKDPNGIFSTKSFQ